MKKKKFSSLQFNIWLYFIAFAVSIVTIVWILQIILFDTNYQRQKLDTLVSTGIDLTEKINGRKDSNDNIDVINTAIASNENGLLPYLAYSNENGELVIESIYYFLSDSSDANQNKNSVDISLVTEAVSRFESQGENKSDYLYFKTTVENESYYIFISYVVSKDGVKDYLVIKGSANSMVESVKVIQTQLVIVSIVAIVVAFFLAWYLSNKLSRPITQMSKTASKWANGDDSITFKANDYQELSELAESLNYAKDCINQTGALQRDLLANVSHDLKTPLTMIKAYAEMIRDLSGNIKEKRDAHTQVIIDEADRLTMLVNDILDLSRLQNGMNNLNVEQINLSELCETVLYRFNDFAVKNGYTIQKEIEEDLFIEADEKKIEQVVYNLVGNSINYTGEDKTIYVKLSRSGDGKIIFETVDSGKGISADKIETIWEKYYRFSETHQRPIKGTGLGLSIVKTILEAHGLKFGVISKKDVGSNFFIEFKES